MNFEFIVLILLALVFVALPVGLLIWAGRRHPRSVLCSVALMTAAVYMPFQMAREEMRQSVAVQNARALGLCLFTYAEDHQGKYPEGTSSTEVFQKLLDEHYLNDEGTRDDLTLLYFPMPGKTPAPPGTRILKPEYVCWDVTAGVDPQSPDQLPLLYLTGFKVTYEPGASAIPLPGPLVTWADWWAGRTSSRRFIIVRNLGGVTKYLAASPDGTIPHFISPEGTLGRETYRQLKP